jgi:hypothetical protein
MAAALSGVALGASLWSSLLAQAQSRTGPGEEAPDQLLATYGLA